MKRIPNIQDGRVDRGKIVDYLLNVEHPDGHSKALFFQSFGFCIEQWKKFAEALHDHARDNALSKIYNTSYGKRYVVDGPIETPDGRNPMIRTVWVVEQGASGPRLVTAYPHTS